MQSVSLYMPQGHAHRYTLDKIVGTGEHKVKPEPKLGSTQVHYKNITKLSSTIIQKPT